MKKDSVTKSIRLSPEQVAFIESQEGKDFTAKLSDILTEYEKGAEQRKKELTYYGCMIEHRKKELLAYTNLAMTFANLRREAVSIEADFNRVMSMFDGVNELEQYISSKKEN